MPDLRDTIAAATEAGKDYVTIQEVKSDGSRAVRPEYKTRGARRVKIVVEGDVMFYGEPDRYAEVMKLNLEGGGSIPSMKDREVTVLVEQTAPELRVDSMTREGIQQQLDDHYGAGTFVVHEFS